MQFIVIWDSPEGSFCFTDVAAHDCSQMNYCGVSYEEATSCSYPCPSGSSFECPSGLTCFLTISAGTCRNNGFCGKSRELAQQNCAVTCEVDDDCGVSEYCYRGIAAQDCDSYNYCGTNLVDAQTCSLPCPLGTDDECPLYEVCFLNINNEECTSTDIDDNFVDLSSASPSKSPAISSQGDELCVLPHSSSQSSFSILTSIDGDSVTFGNMFDIYAYKSIVILGVSIHINVNGEFLVTVY